MVSQTVYSVVICSHRFLDSDCIKFKILHSWLFIDPSEHHYTTQTSEFHKRKVNRSSTMLNNVFNYSIVLCLFPHKFYDRKEIFGRGICSQVFIPFSLFPSITQQRGISLSAVRYCVVVAEERPRVALTNSFSKLFSSLGLSPRAVSTSFGCRVNMAIALQVGPLCHLKMFMFSYNSILHVDGLACSCS